MAGIVLFVCTSNTCRSPMAEGIARSWFAQKLGVKDSELKPKTGWDIRSGGLTDEYEKTGSPASANGVKAMKGHGVDLSAHRSTLLDRPALEAASHIYCVSERHKRWIAETAPAAAPKVRTLGSDIPDPWHQEQRAYDACAEYMMRTVPALLERDFGALFAARK